MSFREGSGSFTVDFVCFIDYSYIGSNLDVLHFDSYLGLGRLSLRFFRFCGNLMVLSSFSSTLSPF